MDGAERRLGLLEVIPRREECFGLSDEFLLRWDVLGQRGIFRGVCCLHRRVERVLGGLEALPELVLIAT